MHLDITDPSDVYWGGLEKVSARDLGDLDEKDVVVVVEVQVHPAGPESLRVPGS